MLFLQWQIALILVLMLFPGDWARFVYFQQQYRKANYKKLREELLGFNSTLQETSLGLMWCSCSAGSNSMPK